jgi:hypothetical protein
LRERFRVGRFFERARGRPNEGGDGHVEMAIDDGEEIVPECRGNETGRRCRFLMRDRHGVVESFESSDGAPKM